MSDVEAAEATKTKKAKKKAKKKAPKANKKAAKATGERKPRAAVIPRDAIIRMGADAEGNAYGPKNNPTRKGSKVFDRFAKYKDGMTVEKAVAAGIHRADIPYHQEQGFITLELPG